MTRIQPIFEALLAHYGPQHWWPAEHPFEVMVGAILVQQTAWRNAAGAVERLRSRDLLHWEPLADVAPAELETLIRSAGFYRLKAARLRRLARFVCAAGGLQALESRPTGVLRKQLLALEGVGAETADAMLLYAFQRPVFVMDAYASRLFGRLTGAAERPPERKLSERVMADLLETDELNEFHALIVEHGKQLCRKQPRCPECFLRARCAHAKRTMQARV